MQAKLETNYGPITIELDQEKTPRTVDNFIEYVNAGFYDGTIFHRVIDGFMIQGGGFEPGMMKKQTSSPIENEADKAQSNKRGTVAMARTNDPHSASAQFFINVSDNAFLDFKSREDDGWGYCVFATVTDGMDVVDKIKAFATTYRHGYEDVPEEDVVIEQVSLLD